MKRMIQIATTSLFILICGLLHATSGNAGVTVGSVKKVQKIAWTRFKGGSNTIARFAEMESGFQLFNSSAACNFDSSFPVYGNIDLKGGDLTLNRNLILEGNADVVSLGNITGNGCTFMLPESMSEFGDASDGTVTFDSVDLVLRSDITLNATINFTGNSGIAANGNILTLGPTGVIVVGSNTRFKIQNVYLKDVNNNLYCADDSSVLTLDNVRWNQDGNASFESGAFIIKNKCVMDGNPGDIFAYQSDQTSTIDVKSKLVVDAGLTFSYDPVNHSDKDLIEFTNRSSRFVLHDATLHATGTGMQLKNGKFVVKGNSFISSEVFDTGEEIINNGISFGNDTSSDDMKCVILPGAQLTVSAGSLDYRNVSAGSWKMQSAYSLLKIESGAYLRLYQDIDLGLGHAVFENNASLFYASGKEISGAVLPRGAFFRELISP